METNWISVNERLPKAMKTVWLANSNGWVGLGCLVDGEDGWHWAESNGIFYSENGEIVAECDSQDIDVEYWHKVPKLNFKK